MPAMQQPEAYLGLLGESVDAQGELIDKTRRFLVKFAEAFAIWVAQHAKK